MWFSVYRTRSLDFAQNHLKQSVFRKEASLERFLLKTINSSLCQEEGTSIFFLASIFYVDLNNFLA